MAVVIRLARMGHSHRPFYRISVADGRVAATKKFLEHIGHYDASRNPPVLKVNEARALRWLSQGAKPSDTVRALLHRQGIMEKAQLIAKGKAKADAPVKTRDWTGKKKPKVHKQAKAAAAKPAEAAKTEAPKPDDATPAAT